MPVAARHRVSRAAALGRADNDQSSERALDSALHRMLDLIDPSPLPKNRLMGYDDLAEKSTPLTAEERHERQAGLDWVCNALLHASWLTLDSSVRDRWNGSGCIDASPMKAYARTETLHHSSSDPDAGPYARSKQNRKAATANDTPVVTDGVPAQGKTPVDYTKMFQAYDLHLFVAGDDRPGERQHLPPLVLAMTGDRPATDPAGNTRRVLASLVHRRLSPAPGSHAYMAMDRLYLGLIPDTFQGPLAEAGYLPVSDYAITAVGRQASLAGMVLVDGNWYCPAILACPGLVDATLQYRKGDIDRAEWQRRIAQRQLFRMRTKDSPDMLGAWRARCPADGGTRDSVAACENKPDSTKERPTRQKDGKVADARPTIEPVGEAFFDKAKNAHLPLVCTAGSVKVGATDGLRWAQPLTYGSDEWQAIFSALRNTQEGSHGHAKDTAREALDQPQRRRVRGKAAQMLFAAFLIAAANIRKIGAWWHNSVVDPTTGDRYTIKNQQERPDRWFLDDQPDDDPDNQPTANTTAATAQTKPKQPPKQKPVQPPHARPKVARPPRPSRGWKPPA